MMKRRHAAALGGERYRSCVLCFHRPEPQAMTCFIVPCHARLTATTHVMRHGPWIEPAKTVHGVLLWCSGVYALQAKHFARLLGADSRTCDPIFNGIFDTDANGLVDAFEAM